MRIISTVPSQTELLYALGLEQAVVGITKFCVHPRKWFKSKDRIGGTKTLNIDKIRALQPDLVIANKEENVKEQIETIATFSKVYVSDVKTIEDNIQLISVIGDLTETRLSAMRLEIEMKAAYHSISYTKQLSAAYLIWKDPYMTIGADTFIHSIMSQCGFVNIFKDKSRYPETTIPELIDLSPELVMLSSEPYPFKLVDVKKLKASLPNSKITLVDGEAFSWYGTRLIKKVEYLNQLSREINLL